MRRADETPSTRCHLLALGALLLLTILSALSGAWVDGHLELTIALLIAAVKVGLVTMIFMNLRRLAPQFALAFAIMLILVITLAGFVIGDVALRPEPGEAPDPAHSSE